MYLQYIRDNAAAIIESSPVSYVRNAELHGTLFNSVEDDGTVSCANTGFFVDHTKPLQAMSIARERTAWPIGDLINGHEFLLLKSIVNDGVRVS